MLYIFRQIKDLTWLCCHRISEAEWLKQSTNKLSVITKHEHTSTDRKMNSSQRFLSCKAVISLESLFYYGSYYLLFSRKYSENIRTTHFQNLACQNKSTSIAESYSSATAIVTLLDRNATNSFRSESHVINADLLFCKFLHVCTSYNRQRVFKVKIILKQQIKYAT